MGEFLTKDIPAGMVIMGIFWYSYGLIVGVIGGCTAIALCLLGRRLFTR